MGGARMEVTKMWLAPKEVAAIYEISYHEALDLAKSGEIDGYWRGNRFRFNAEKMRLAFEDGTLERVLSGR